MWAGIWAAKMDFQEGFRLLQKLLLNARRVQTEKRSFFGIQPLNDDLRGNPSVAYTP